MCKDVALVGCKSGSELVNNFPEVWQGGASDGPSGGSGAGRHSDEFDFRLAARLLIFGETQREVAASGLIWANACVGVDEVLRPGDEVARNVAVHPHDPLLVVAALLVLGISGLHPPLVERPRRSGGTLLSVIIHL